MSVISGIKITDGKIQYRQYTVQYMSMLVFFNRTTTWNMLTMCHTVIGGFQRIPPTDRMTSWLIMSLTWFSVKVLNNYRIYCHGMLTLLTLRDISPGVSSWSKVSVIQLNIATSTWIVLCRYSWFPDDVFLRLMSSSNVSSNMSLMYLFFVYWNVSTTVLWIAMKSDQTPDDDL